MKLIIGLALLLSASAFAQDSERCTWGQMENTLRISTAICDRYVNDFALKNNATCRVSRYHVNVCWAYCKDSMNVPLAKVRVDMYSDCDREEAYYSKTVIKYYR